MFIGVQLVLAQVMQVMQLEQLVRRGIVAYHIHITLL